MGAEHCVFAGFSDGSKNTQQDVGPGGFHGTGGFHWIRCTGSDAPEDWIATKAPDRMMSCKLGQG
jgi:hypothetical protein